MADVEVTITNLKKIEKEVLDQLAPDILVELVRFAKEELLLAFQGSTYAKDKTQNLADSYVWGVYYNGKLHEYGFLTNSKKATQPRRVSNTTKSVYGRDEALAFINSYKPKTKMFEVIFAVEMYYGSYLEGGTRRNKPYLVLSSIYNDLNSNKMLDVTFTKTYPDGTSF